MSDKTFLFDVRGIRCEGCAKKITDALVGHGFATKLDVDVQSGKVTIQGQPSTTAMSLKTEIEKLGFKVSKFETK
ncbi:MAG: heavy-metal-associated domain-containing protein [Bdellovibrio sp.]|nr:heavy-metal-associated domain-containing protein [Bdellovibrio sp.]